MTPRSVMMALTSLAGVTSKAGLRTAHDASSSTRDPVRAADVAHFQAIAFLDFDVVAMSAHRDRWSTMARRPRRAGRCHVPPVP
jgi:hypothetical protein